MKLLLPITILISHFCYSQSWKYKIDYSPFDDDTIKAAMVNFHDGNGNDQLFSIATSSDVGSMISISWPFVCSDELDGKLKFAFKSGDKWDVIDPIDLNMDVWKASDSKSIYVYRFTPKDGEIIASISTKFINLLKSSSELMIKVDDDHCGIETATIPLIGSSASLSKLTIVYTPEGN